MNYAVLLLLTLFVSPATGYSNNSSYDIIQYKKYVWARDGIPVRANPDLKSETIDSLHYGDAVRLLEETDISFSLKLIDTINAYNLTHIYGSGPYIMEGQWVLIETKKKIRGYVYDQYLLDFKPNTLDLQSCQTEINLPVQFIDTLYRKAYKPEPYYYAADIKHKYTNGIEKTKFWAGTELYSEIRFNQSNFDEALIILSARENNFKNYTLLLNWKERIFFEYDDECTYELTKCGQGTLLKISCVR